MKRLLEASEVKEFKTMLDTASQVVLTCHVRPDGDAIGSTLGLAHLLRRIGKEATVVVPDTPPRSLAFLPGFKEVVVYTRYEPWCERLVHDADLIICCDFNTPSRQDNLAPLIQSAPCRKIMIDHHQEPVRFTDLMLSYSDMSSTCELCFRLIAAAGLYEELDSDSATCLLTGLVTDTRNFSVNCKHADIYEILERLIEKGADKTKIVKEALMTRSYWSIKLESYALAEKLEVFADHHAALVTLDSSELERYHYERGDTEGLVNRALEIRGVVYAIFMRQDPDCIKVSARSINDFPVSEICKDLFNGGGHRMAAGGEFRGSLAECRQRLIDAMGDYDHYLGHNLSKIEI